MSNDPNWPFTFSVGAFVRDRRNHRRWGQIAEPSKNESWWVIQYSEGGRFEASTEQIETFRPTADDHAKMRVSFIRYKNAVDDEKRAKGELHDDH